MNVWLSKRPPEPFYGPEDYFGQDIDEAIKDADLAIERWYAIRVSMSVKDTIRHLFSLYGCQVEDRRDA